MSLPKQVISLINDSSLKILSEDLTIADIFNSASQRACYPILYNLYEDIKPTSSKLADRYHWKNLEASITEDLKNNVGLEQKIAQRYLGFHVNFGKKFLVIDQLSADEDFVKSFESFKAATSDLEVNQKSFLNDDSADGSDSAMKVVSFQKTTEGSFVFILHEAIETFSYTSLPETFLTETGKNFIHDMRWKKRVIKNGFHKVILDKNKSLRIFLIDSNSIASDESAVDKVLLANNALKNFLGCSNCEDKYHRVAFFPAIQKIYDDTVLGEVVGGCFYTSSSSRYMNYSKGTGSDLRKDPFQMGGQKADKSALKFIRIAVQWSASRGVPEISLVGNAEMFSIPEKSLHAVEVLFSCENGGMSDFLEKPLSYGEWRK